jgi:regulator of protease activity HflC (stomatin/prohibitin superfamily)
MISCGHQFFQISTEEVGLLEFGKYYVRQVEPGLNFKSLLPKMFYRVPVEEDNKN